MMDNIILVPVDSSALSKRALTHALKLAKNTGSKLTVLYINQIIPFCYVGSLGPERHYIPLEKHQAEDALNTMLADMGIQSDHISKRSATGNPVPLIVKVAVEERANLIVMGSCGHAKLAGLLLGSVSHFVIKHAPCPVLIVK